MFIIPNMVIVHRFWPIPNGFHEAGTLPKDNRVVKIHRCWVGGYQTFRLVNIALEHDCWWFTNDLLYLVKTGIKPVIFQVASLDCQSIAAIAIAAISKSGQEVVKSRHPYPIQFGTHW